MLEPQQVIHSTINGKYRVKFERAATKGVIGFTVEANNDDRGFAMIDAQWLMKEAEKIAVEPPVEVNLTPAKAEVKA